MANYADFDAIMLDNDNRGDRSSDTLTIPPGAVGDGVKRSVRLGTGARSDDPADVHAAAMDGGAIGNRTARVGDADYNRKRPLTGSRAARLADALTGYAPPRVKRAAPKRPAGSKRPSKRERKRADRAALANRGGVDPAVNGTPAAV